MHCPLHRALAEDACDHVKDSEVREADVENEEHFPKPTGMGEGRHHFDPGHPIAHGAEERQHGCGQRAPVLCEERDLPLVQRGDVLRDGLREQDRERVNDHPHEEDRPDHRPDRTHDGVQQPAQRPDETDDPHDPQDPHETHDAQEPQDAYAAGIGADAPIRRHHQIDDHLEPRGQNDDHVEQVPPAGLPEHGFGPQGRNAQRELYGEGDRVHALDDLESQRRLRAPGRHGRGALDLNP
mmetsp:Transcript_103648/g.317345  ORF Transcript_103648/g.317345 Transcript_103648/m.317345 type:complete len:239 (-) Transcript_103648:518-1234(-)